MTKSLIGVSLACLALALAGARDDDPDDAALRSLQGQRAFENNCLMCHAAPITALQRLTREQWKAEVTKMVGWGAPLPEEDREPLIDFLHARYGESVPRVRAGRTTIKAAEASLASPRDVNEGPTLTGDMVRGGKLFSEHCASCHGVDGRGGAVGTNLIQKPILDRRADFREIVRDGKHRMPGFKQALDRSAETDILWWLMFKDSHHNP